MASSVSGLSPIGSPEIAAPPFTSGAEHLLASVAILQQRLHLEILRLRARGQLVENDFRGLFLSDEHIDALLHESPGSSFSAEAAELAQGIENAEQELAARVNASVHADIFLPITHVAQAFRLSSFERNVLIACAAPDIDLRFESFFAYVQNDVTRKRPATDLLLKLYAGQGWARIQHRNAFLAGSALLIGGLLTPADESTSLLARTWRVDEHIAQFLLDGAGVEPRLHSFCKILRTTKFAPLLLPPDLLRDLANAATVACEEGGVFIFSGPSGSGRRSIAEALSGDHRHPLLVADLAHIHSSTLPLAEILRLLFREATLHAAHLYLANAQSLLVDKGPSPSLATLGTELQSYSRAVFLGTDEHAAQFKRVIPSARVFELPIPSAEHRATFWDLATRKAGIDSSVDAQEMANKFALTGGQIHSACQNAAAIARLRSDGEPTAVDLDAAARLESHHGLGKFAQKIALSQSWNDLVLSIRALQQLRAAASAYRHRNLVYSDWGFGQRLAMGKGLNVLFWGPSGTGKTMAAGVLARELGLDMYKIDLSSVVSKYIGETEKQLNIIFREAQSSNAILFFDEADALFGKRSEVKDAHDRYANVETAYLLQKMEEYEGVCILTTNFRKNVDDAFARRMHHVVEFTFPDSALRLQIWQGIFHERTQLAPDVDLAFLARQFELAGGNIRNVALAAAFLAAEEKSAISMPHLILATARELQKLGKLPSPSDFRHYYDMIHGQV